MCGRYVLAGDADDYAYYFSVDRIATESLAPSHNVAPTDPVYAVAEWDGERILTRMGWGLVPHWAGDERTIHINARVETVTTRPAFRRSLTHRRCLIPADGFYEWEPRDRGHTPHFIYRADGYPMGFAGIWATRPEPGTGGLVRTCAIVTGPARGVIAGLHDRMPIPIPSDAWAPWLDRGVTDPDMIESLLQPIDPGLIMEHPVASLVNDVRNNGPELTAPSRRLPEQGTLL